MAHSDPIDVDRKSPPFDQFKTIQRLATDRSGRASVDHVRHHLYVARDRKSNANVLIKLTAKPGLVYQRDLANEIASLSTINRELPDSRHFPIVLDHGRLRDDRVYLITNLFDEFPLATGIGSEQMPGKTISHLRTAIEIGRLLMELHGLEIFHVDLNPMNILRRVERGRPVIRIVDFESSYEVARHSAGEAYSPPTTPGYSAPEVCSQPPDARADVFSLGAVLYTMLAGYQWSWKADVGPAIETDEGIDAELKHILRRAVDVIPDQRYPSVRRFHADLGGYLERIWPGRSW